MYSTCRSNTAVRHAQQMAPQPRPKAAGICLNASLNAGVETEESFSSSDTCVLLSFLPAHSVVALVMADGRISLFRWPSCGCQCQLRVADAVTADNTVPVRRLWKSAWLRSGRHVAVDRAAGFCPHPSRQTGTGAAVLSVAGLQSGADPPPLSSRDAPCSPPQPARSPPASSLPQLKRADLKTFPCRFSAQQCAALGRVVPTSN